MSDITIETLTRALHESQAERDRLAAELERTRQARDIYKHWVALEDDDEAVLVVCDVDDDEGSWLGVFRHHEHAERFAELVRDNPIADLPACNAAALEGTVPAKGLNLWNSYDPVQRPASAS
jgi:hypothetical protein